MGPEGLLAWSCVSTEGRDIHYPSPVLRALGMAFSRAVQLVGDYWIGLDVICFILNDNNDRAAWDIFCEPPSCLVPASPPIRPSQFCCLSEGQGGEVGWDVLLKFLLLQACPGCSWCFI